MFKCLEITAKGSEYNQVVLNRTEYEVSIPAKFNDEGYESNSSFYWFN